MLPNISSYKIASNTLLSKLDAVYHSAVCFVTKDPYTTHHCDLYALTGWPSLHIRRQTHWLQIIYKSLLGKAPPYLSSLVTIATPTRSKRSSRYISLVIPKTNTPLGHLSFQFSAANDWNELQKSLKLETYILPIAAPVHSPSVNGTTNSLIPILLFTLLLFCTYSLLHIIVCTSITTVLMINCNYFTSMAYFVALPP
jgi:hypothetical protein